MKYSKTEIPGLIRITQDRFHDERGFYGRQVLRDEFEQNGLSCDFAQLAIAHNPKKGTLRGMHFQAPPFDEFKMVTCIRGSVYDVIIDLREDSPTFKKWQAFELSDKNGEMLYIPKGCAHGYQTLEDYSDIHYGVTAPYSPEHGRGVLWDDPAFKVEWPAEKARIISPRDLAWNRF